MRTKAAERKRARARPKALLVALARGAVLLVMGIVGGAILVYLAWKGTRPYFVQRAQRGELVALSRQEAALRRENLALQAQARHLSSKEGALMEARKLGWLKPGERALRFLPPQSDTSPQEKRSRRPPTHSERLRILVLRALGKKAGP